MNPIRMAIAVSLATMLASAPVAAQSDEPTPPKSDEAAPPKSDEAAPPKSDEPASPSGDEPTAPGDKHEPGKDTGEPGQSKEEPQSPQPPESVAKKKAEAASYGIGVHLRAIFVHEWLLNAFLDASTPLNSMAFGAEFIRRKANMDLIASIDFGFYGPEDGNYLGNNKNPQTETDYVQFRDFNILSFSGHIVWHEKLTEWLSFVYGVGIGIGIVFGDIYRISNDPARCTKENVDDINQCYPRGVNPQTREEDLKRLTGGTDSPLDPHLFKEDDVPPVVPMVHMLVGFNFKISEQFSVRVDGGFRNAFYFGATGYWFL